MIAACLACAPASPALAAPSPPTPGPQPARGASRRIDIELQDANLRDVFRLFEDIGKINIVVERGVEGRVTCLFRDTPWDEVLRHIIRATGHALIREGNVYYVKKRDR